MATVTGQDFLALQVHDLEKAADFYEKVVGLKRSPKSPPDAVLFLTSPIPFAVRKPHGNLDIVPSSAMVQRYGFTAQIHWKCSIR